MSVNLKDNKFAFYDYVQWSDEADVMPNHFCNKHAKSMWWYRSEKTPVKNENRAVFITLPTAKDIDVNSQFWCLYSPALSAINGFDEFPEEIIKSGFMLCSVLECLKKTDEGVWFIVTVIDLKMFDETLKLIDATSSPNSLLTSMQLFKNYSDVTWQDWLYISNYADEGYIGNEFFIQKKGSFYHLVCYIEWVYSLDLRENQADAWYGNLRLSQKTVQDLKSLVNNYPSKCFLLQQS